MKKDIDQIIRQIAEAEQVSEEEVLARMQEAIDAGYNSPDPAIRAEWERMPFAGKPTPQDFLLYMAKRIAGPPRM